MGWNEEKVSFSFRTAEHAVQMLPDAEKSSYKVPPAYAR